MIRNELAKKTGKYSNYWIKYISILIVITFLIWNLFPILWVVITSIKPDRDVMTIPPRIQFKPTLEHYKFVLRRGNFLKYFLNSLIIAASSTCFSLFIGATAAYGFARYRFRYKRKMFLIILASRMIPPVSLVVPLFFLMRALRLLGTYWSMIIAHATFILPLSIWMMRSFFEDVPIEIEEQAMIDGCNRLQTMWFITLRLAVPGLAAVTLLSIIQSWNEFMFALVLTGGHLRTLTVAISGFLGDVVVFYGRVTAASTLVMLPMLILGIVIQKNLIRGLTMGALK